MSDLRKITIAASVSLLMLGTAADAAMLAGIQGRVLVNSGGGYQAVSGSLELKPGDLVMAGPGGGASLSFEDGCVTAVGPGAVVAISQHSPCVTQVQAQEQQQQQPGGGQGGTGGTGGNSVGSQGGGMGGGPGGLGGGLGGFGGFGPAALTFGAAVVGGTLGIVAAVNNNGNTSKPASP